MSRVFLGFVAAGALTAQTIGGPVLGFVVDADARMRPVYGMLSSAHVGAAVREEVRDAWGPLALLNDGTALRNGTALEGRWASLQPGAFVDATGRELLVAGSKAAPWRLALPDPAIDVRVSASGEHAATLLADGSITVWSSGGKADFRLAASPWWSLAFSGERALAYDPAANALLWLDGPAGATLLRQLDGPAGRYTLAVGQSGRNAVLLGERLLIVPLSEGDVRVLTPPDGADRLEPIQDGKAFLLTRNPSRSLWVLDPERQEGLFVIPALAAEKGGR